MKVHYFSILTVLLISFSSFIFSGKPKATLKHISAGKKVTIYRTAENTNERLALAETIEFTPVGQPLETQPCVFVDPAKTFQTFIGIGGALTDASAETFAKLPALKQAEFLRAYYDPKAGIHYTFGRTNINSCDFSSDNYTYVADGDKSLKTFNIQHDKRYKIPFIKRVISTTGGKFNLFASPWSPPAWMKDNDDMLHGGKLKHEYYQPWANYFTKFIRAYEKEGIPIWGVTIQNEPMATQKWESCIFSAEDETNFLKNNLGPTFKREGLSSRKIMIWDHNRDLLYQRASSLLRDPAAAKYAWGIGFHWYEDWSGADQVFDNVRRVADAFPGKKLVFTEGCNDKFDLKKINDWNLGERYGRSMINDFNNGTVAWTDWNVLLDEKGGPNHVGNYCFAPIHADTRKGELIYTNSYYYIGHFSKFIQPGAKRINCAPSRSPLQSTAFKNPDGSIAVIVMNSTDKEIPFQLWVKGDGARTKSLAHSIMTLVY
jgi:glucosylceramidase